MGKSAVVVLEWPSMTKCPVLSPEKNYIYIFFFFLQPAVASWVTFRKKTVGFTQTGERLGVSGRAHVSGFKLK